MSARYSVKVLAQTAESGQKAFKSNYAGRSMLFKI